MRFLISLLLLSLAGCSTVAPQYQYIGADGPMPRKDVAVLHSVGIKGVDRTGVIVNTGLWVTKTGYVLLKPGLHEVHYELGSPDNAYTGGVRSNVFFKALPGRIYRLRTAQIPLLGYIPALGQRAEVVDVTDDPKWQVKGIDAAFGTAPASAASTDAAAPTQAAGPETAAADVAKRDAAPATAGAP
ncbi:MAG: hypothetical protein K0Q68_2594 [Moraxellaceae bacterium]|nr:hypothetical protein [Moraxellaceae bacterium]